MSADTDTLREIYMEVAEEPTVVERQEEEPSREPIEASESQLEAEVSSFARQHGLDDALEGVEAAE